MAAPRTATVTRTRGYTAGMIKRIALLSLLSCLLAACGNKGPLVLPDKPAPSATPEQPATEQPANGEPGAPATQP